MRVLHIFNEIKFSGGEIMYSCASSIFQKEGFQLYALSTGPEIGEYCQNFRDNSITVIHKPVPTSILYFFSWLSYFYFMYNLIKTDSIDIIHIHRADVFFFFSICAFFTKKKCIYTVHNVFKHRRMTWLKGYGERLIARKFFNLTFQAIGESVYLNELNYYRNPSIKINNWYDPLKFYPVTSEFEKSEIRRKLDIPKKAFVIISVGGCSQIKNHFDIIKALKNVASERKILYLHLGSGNTECSERDMVQTLNLSNFVRFVGNKQNVRDYLIASDIFVMTSHFEGLGNAAIEAMACGIPTILYDVPGLRDLIKIENSGYLIEKKVETLADKIVLLYENDSLVKEIGKNSFKFVEENFSMDKSTGEIVKFYNKKL